MAHTDEVRIPVEDLLLEGSYAAAGLDRAVVVFAHGSGSGRHSPRNQYVARVLQEAGLSTLLFDLLSPSEEAEEHHTRHLRFNISLLAKRLIGATEWLRTREAGQTVGYFGASTGAGAALVAAAHYGSEIDAVVSRGGRPDLAGAALARVTSPTLLIVGGDDLPVIQLNRRAYAQLKSIKALKIIPGASHLFEERGALEQVAQLASEWFQSHLLREKK